MTGAWASNMAQVTASLRGLRCSDISLTQLCGAGTIYFKNMLVQDGNTLGSWPGPGNGLYMFNPIYVQAGGKRDA